MNVATSAILGADPASNPATATAAAAGAAILKQGWLQKRGEHFFLFIDIPNLQGYHLVNSLATLLPLPRDFSFTTFFNMDRYQAQLRSVNLLLLPMDRIQAFEANILDFLS